MQPVQPGDGMQVFLLDDELYYTQPNIDAMERRNFKVRSTDDVGEAVRILSEEGTTFEVLVLDMLMPGSSNRPGASQKNPMESGLRLHERIRGELNLVAVPIIFTSVVRDQNIRNRILEEEKKYRNRVTFMTKQFLPSELIREIQKVTSNAKRADEHSSH
jgi:DNA-binding response OmpR family regulator